MDERKAVCKVNIDDLLAAPIMPSQAEIEFVEVLAMRFATTMEGTVLSITAEQPALIVLAEVLFEGLDTIEEKKC